MLRDPWPRHLPPHILLRLSSSHTFLNREGFGASCCNGDFLEDNSASCNRHHPCSTHIMLHFWNMIDGCMKSSTYYRHRWKGLIPALSSHTEILHGALSAACTEYRGFTGSARMESASHLQWRLLSTLRRLMKVLMGRPFFIILVEEATRKLILGLLLKRG